VAGRRPKKKVRADSNSTLYHSTRTVGVSRKSNNSSLRVGGLPTPRYIPIPPTSGDSNPIFFARVRGWSLFPAIFLSPREKMASVSFLFRCSSARRNALNAKNAARIESSTPR